jgi:hypothetical protein
MNKSPILKNEVAPKPNKQPLSEETVRALQELGEVFRQIHRRLISEGYTIRDGKITKPMPGDTNNGIK